ncbi:MAG TPA: hypothetical protein VNL14_01890 [Candidatus Acidoferrales bacterium]|nr:hypothetical protein [Candidatus Acidoferrales bacterium]
MALKHWRDGSTVFLIFAALFSLFSRTAADPDLWGHVKFGEDLWNSGKLVRSDPYSYLTGGQAWINHEWLAELLLFFAYRFGGPSGLVVLKACTSILIFGLLYHHLRREGFNVVSAAILLLTGSFPLLPYLLTVRPQAFTFLFFLLVALIVRRAEQGHCRGLWALPFIFALWVNLHGGVLAGLGLLFLWLFFRVSFVIVEKRSLSVASHMAVIAPLVVAVFATLLNPYGSELLQFLVRTATVARPEIIEWTPMKILSVEGAMYVSLLALAVAGLLQTQRERKPVPVALFVCMSVLPLVAVRHLPLFSIAALVFVTDHIADFWNQRFSSRAVRDSSRRLLVMTALQVFTGVLLIGGALRNFQCIRVSPAVSLFPARAIALLKESKVSGNLAVHFDWGEYALWHLSPQIKVSMDGRRETVYSDAIYKETQDFMHGLGEWDRLLERRQTDLALVSKKFASFNLMKLKPGWVAVYEDPMSALFVREASRLAPRIQETTLPMLPYNGAGLCFP